MEFNIPLPPSPPPFSQPGENMRQDQHQGTPNLSHSPTSTPSTSPALSVRQNPTTMTTTTVSETPLVAGMEIGAKAGLDGTKGVVGERSSSSWPVGGIQEEGVVASGSGSGSGSVNGARSVSFSSSYRRRSEVLRRESEVSSSRFSHFRKEFSPMTGHGLKTLRFHPLDPLPLT